MATSTGPNVVCYFTSWSIYRPDNGKFAAANVDPKLCTHILYAFVGLREDGNLQVLDDWEMTGLKEMANLTNLKKQNPDLKIMLSMGGWNEGSSKYSQVAGNPNSRAVMIKSVLDFIAKYHLDGFDLDWEYPCQRGGNVQTDRVNFVTLLGELKTALNAKGLILSAAVSGGVKSIDISYDVPGVSKNLDMINIMAYDFHGSFEPFVGHHCPLYPSSRDTTKEQRSRNVAAGIQRWLDLGADPRKMNLGLGFYGRSFTLADPNNANLYAPTTGGGNAGPYTRQAGILGYNEICEFCTDWEYVWDDEQKVPHKVHGNQWVGYEDEKSLKFKIEFAKSKNLGGAMVWSLDTDDFRNTCRKGAYPLLTTVNEAFKN